MDVVRISPGEARSKMAEGYTYVDVRTPEEFAEGRPAGSINVPIGDGFVADMTARFGKDARLIVGCKAGARSLRAATLLLEAGFTDVLEQRAGFDGVRSPFGQLVEAGWSGLAYPEDAG